MFTAALGAQEKKREMATTAMCEMGNHGTAERRYVDRDPDGWSASFRDMWRGQCAGTCFDMSTREETPCACACHERICEDPSHWRGSRLAMCACGQGFRIA